MILEGLVTTIGPDEVVNLAPMGPKLFAPFHLATGIHFELRPFQTSRTWTNLRHNPHGVLHVHDNVLLLAQAAIGQIAPFPDLFPARQILGQVLSDACRAYEFRVAAVDDQSERIRLQCLIVEEHRLRDFFGLNRAMHAVVEAAILATRVHLLPCEQIHQEFHHLEILVQKTGGPREVKAFNLLQHFVDQHSLNSP